MSPAFVRSIRDLAKSEGAEIVSFAKGERKDEVTQQRWQGFSAPEDVRDRGKAQEQFASFRVTQRFSAKVQRAQRHSVSLTQPCHGAVPPSLFLLGG